MLNFIRVVKTELKQSRIKFLLIAFAAFTFGLAFYLTIFAENRIESLTHSTPWNADLVVIPKGISLAEFANEISSGNSYTFLPESLFDSIENLAKEKIQLTAILPLAFNKQPQILIKSNAKPIGIEWIQNSAQLLSWREQSKYQTSDWGYKVIAGFFASGDVSTIKSLKELIDRKTVAQSLLIQDQIKIQQEQKLELDKYLFSFIGVLFFQAGLLFFTLFFWLRVQLQNTLAVLKELGFANMFNRIFLLTLTGLCLLIPMLAGFLSGQFITT